MRGALPRANRTGRWTRAMNEPRILRIDPSGPPDAGLAPISDLTPDMLEEGSPVELAHDYYTSPSGVLTAGVWECTPHRTHFMRYPVDEFMLLLEGAVTIVHEGGHEETFHRGEAFVIPRGLHCAWKQKQTVRKIYMILDDPSHPIPEKPVAERAIRLERNGPAGIGLAPLVLPNSSLFQGAPPKQHDHTYFVNATGQLNAGVWTCTPMQRKPLPFPRTELMCLLEGSVTLTDGEGVAHTFRAPDVFFVPYGVVNAWSSTENVRKFYCIFEEPGAEE